MRPPGHRSSQESREHKKWPHCLVTEWFGFGFFCCCSFIFVLYFEKGRKWERKKKKSERKGEKEVMNSGTTWWKQAEHGSESRQLKDFQDPEWLVSSCGVMWTIPFFLFQIIRVLFYFQRSGAQLGKGIIDSISKIHFMFDSMCCPETELLR